MKGNSENDQNRMDLSSESKFMKVGQPSNAENNDRLFEDSRFLECCEEVIKHIRPKYQ